VSYAQVAETVRNATRLDAESSPLAYASRIQVVLVPSTHVAHGAELRGKHLYWDASLPPAQQRASVGREICRWLLRIRNERETERSLRKLYAIMFPFCEQPVSWSLRARSLRLLPPVLTPKRCAASPRERLDRQPALAALPR
jgi:hypothetical protein